MKMSNRISLKLLQVKSWPLNLSKIWLILKNLNKNTGAPSRRNRPFRIHLNKLRVVIMKKFLNSATLGRRCVCALSSQTIILRQSLSSASAGNSLKCMRPGISVASKNIWICRITNGKSLQINVWKRMKMVKQEW